MLRKAATLAGQALEVTLRDGLCEALLATNSPTDGRLGLCVRLGEGPARDSHRVFTRYELLSLAPDRWVSNFVVSMMARALIADSGHGYYFDTTFGEAVCNFKASLKTSRAQIVAHFGRFFRPDFTEFEPT